MSPTTSAMTQSAATVLPEWAILFAFAASVILTVLKVWEIVRDLSRVGKLEVRLTRDLMMRVVSEGEMFFVDAVFLAKGGDILVRGIELRLTKLGDVRKELPLDLRWVGEKGGWGEGGRVVGEVGG